MKLRFAFLLFPLFLLSCAGTGGHGVLPGEETNVAVSAVLPEDYPREATTYRVSWAHPDPDKAVQAFLGDGTVTVKEEKFYTDYLKADSGHLFLYADHLEINPGGVQYSNERQAERLDNIGKAMLNERSDFSIDQYLAEKGMLCFSEEETLSFTGRDEAAEQTLQILSEAGLPELSVKTIQAADPDTLNHNREVYNRAISENGWEDAPIEDPFTEEDACYLLSFREVLDGIPFCDQIWMLETREIATEVTGFAVYGADGLYSFDAYGLQEVQEAVRTDTLISPEDALAVLEREKNFSRDVETEILTAELNYVVVCDADGYYARPAWCFDVKTKIPYEEPDLDLQWNILYQTYAVSADTGVLLLGETDLR